MAYTIPAYRITETGLTELVGKDEKIDLNDYGASVSITLGDSVQASRLISGELLTFMLVSSVEGTGAVLQSNGWVLIFDADPAIAAGDTAITAVERQTLISQVQVSSTDWIADASGASHFIFNQPIAFHGLQTIYLAWFHKHATAINSAAGDDEVLDINIWYRRDS